MVQSQAKRDVMPTLVVILFAIFGIAMVFGVVRGVFVDQERDEQERAEACEDDYGYLLQIESYGHAAVDSHLWGDFRDCEQLDGLNAYLDARIVARQASNDCTGLDLQVGAELARMLDLYGECDGVPLIDDYEATAEPVAAPVAEPAPPPAPPVPAASAPLWPGGAAVPWNDAITLAGTAQRVCGPLASIRGDDSGVYLNIGRDYPDAARFTIVFWDVAWVDPIARGTVVCASGTIVSYGGVAQIHTYPENVEIWP